MTPAASASFTLRSDFFDRKGKFVVPQNRSLDSCSFRRVVQDAKSEHVATCGLLEELTGVQSTELLGVSESACQACCTAFAPTAEDLNPVVASLLYHLTEAVVERDGVGPCSVERAKELNVLAERSLPPVKPHEDDFLDPATVAPADASGVTDDVIRELLPAPEQSCERGVRRWSVGITTAPRRKPTLDACIESLRSAGWSDITFFVDGDVEIPEPVAEMPYCRRQPAVGAFPNYLLSLGEMYMRQPDADAYMLIQDDALFPASTAVRDYVEDILWPGTKPGIVSLYCGAEYTQDTPGWHCFSDSWVWGAVAFIFAPSALETLLTDTHLLRHRTLPDGAGLRRIDVAFGEAALANDIPIYFPSPSLVQHIGNISAIWSRARAVSKRRADRFIGDMF